MVMSGGEGAAPPAAASTRNRRLPSREEPGPPPPGQGAYGRHYRPGGRADSRNGHRASGTRVFLPTAEPHAALSRLGLVWALGNCEKQEKWVKSACNGLD